MSKVYYNCESEFSNWYDRIGRIMGNSKFSNLYTEINYHLSFLQENDILLEVVIKRYIQEHENENFFP